ncbi:hypothetical protein M9H77_23341 [Catharanthus roseus]|uniref:Uncharacterized protein n=1 Tax=Catharanthus roseus TaxID=4058 RepID=A0ACC0ASQ7_CATRO|nr:hypothetical protein M9H77_23341 [Catharanthus roseus]
MEHELHHIQQAIKGLEQQLSCLAKIVRDLKREEEAILEQSSRRNLGGHSMHNFYHGGCNGDNAYSGNNHRNGNFTPKRYIGHNSYDYYEVNRLGREMESLFYSDGIREEEKFQLVLKSFSYVVNDGWDYNSEYRRRIGLKPIRTWNLMKQALRNRYGVENHEGQEQSQAKITFIEPSTVEQSP